MCTIIIKGSGRSANIISEAAAGPAGSVVSDSLNFFFNVHANTPILRSRYSSPVVVIGTIEAPEAPSFSLAVATAGTVVC